MLVRTASRFLFGAYKSVPWQSKKPSVDVETGKISVLPDEIGTWIHDENAYLFRLEPGPPIQLPQLRTTVYSARHRFGEGPTFGERGADLSIDLDRVDVCAGCVCWMCVGCVLRVYCVWVVCVLEVCWVCFGCVLHVCCMCDACVLHVCCMCVACVLHVCCMCVACVLHVCFMCVTHVLQCVDL